MCSIDRKSNGECVGKNLEQKFDLRTKLEQIFEKYMSLYLGILNKMRWFGRGATLFSKKCCNFVLRSIFFVDIFSYKLSIRFPVDWACFRASLSGVGLILIEIQVLYIFFEYIAFVFFNQGKSSEILVLWVQVGEFSGFFGFWGRRLPGPRAAQRELRDATGSG